MLLGEPSPTPADLNFSLLGVPIRVSAWFWLAGLLLGQAAAEWAGPRGLIIWLLAIFLSILIHELGHALAFRRYGIEAYIVLYHLGGLAIPARARGGGYGAARQTPGQEIVISAAGPVAQLASALLLMAGMHWGGRQIPIFPGLQRALGITGGVPLPEGDLRYLVAFFLWASVYWAAINLLPVYPLDGGQIARNLFQMSGDRRAIQHSLLASLGAGALVAVWGFTQQQPFLALMFALLAYSSYQALQAYGGGFGSRW